MVLRAERAAGFTIDYMADPATPASAAPDFAELTDEQARALNELVAALEVAREFPVDGAQRSWASALFETDGSEEMARHHAWQHQHDLFLELRNRQRSGHEIRATAAARKRNRVNARRKAIPVQPNEIQWMAEETVRRHPGLRTARKLKIAERMLTDHAELAATGISRLTLRNKFKHPTLSRRRRTP